MEWIQTTPFSDTHAHTESCHQYCRGTVSVYFRWFETPLGGLQHPAACFSWATCVSVIFSEPTKVITFSLFFFLSSFSFFSRVHQINHFFFFFCMSIHFLLKSLLMSSMMLYFTQIKSKSRSVTKARKASLNNCFIYECFIK